MDSATQSDLDLPISEDSCVQSLLQKTDCQQKDVNQLPSWLEYASCMIHLSVFGILGVITRYLLQKLFGPEGIGATRDGSVLYLDLPSNVIGCFLMGWIGVVFKPDIANVSDQLALGLSTGFLGSLTTFSGWNQKMLDLSVNGNWVFVFLGFLLGLFLAAYSIIFGIETAQGIQWLSQRIRRSSLPETRDSKRGFRVNTLWRHTVVIIVLLSTWGTLWTLSATMFTKEFHARDAQLWLGCLVGPPGVWVRWWLARFNGRGLGQANRLSWLPFGTLSANVSAACMMAALATLKKVVNAESSVMVVNGIQLGFVGNLSTVSTMMAEFNSMRESKSDLTMSIVPRDFGAGDERSLSDEIFDRHHQLFQHFRDRFNFPSFHDDHFFFPTPFSSFPFPFSTSRSLPYSELSIETDGSLNSRLECKEIPEAYLFVADLPPGVERDQVIVQVESSDGSPALRISGDGGGGGWGRFNWKMKLPPNANLEHLGSSIENGVVTVVVPKVGVWGATPPLPPPQSRNVRVVEITGSD